MPDFTHIESFIFDLDNTLYPADCHLFSQIDRRMTEFIEKTLDLPHAKARHLQKHYYAVHGTTLRGLMQEHGVPPQDFMSYVHDIDLTPVEKNQRLRDAINMLPGEKYIFTNGSVRHAENVAGKIGILDLFDGIFDVSHAGYVPKPHHETYQRFMGHFDVTPTKAAMFEDLPVNLEAPHAMGLTTVLVQSDAAWFDDEPEEKRPGKPGEQFPHVHHVTEDLTGFLTSLRTAA
jgi:putative hydrolase of the HAD superfamily